MAILLRVEFIDGTIFECGAAKIATLVATDIGGQVPQVRGAVVSVLDEHEMVKPPPTLFQAERVG